MTARPEAPAIRIADVILRVAIVGLTLGTAYIHAMLGGPLFLANAAGYFALAAGMVLPLRILGRHRGIVRLALIAFATATILGWLVDGPRYSTAYVAKAIELALIGLLVVELLRGAARRGLVIAACLALVAVVVAACGSGAVGTDDPTSIEPSALTIEASNLAFSTSELSAPADEPFQIVFQNDDSAPHNVAIYTDASATTKILADPPFGGPRREVYEVPALSLGTYFFRCDVHPEMSGRLTTS